MRKPLDRTESQVPADGDVGTSDQHTRGPWRTRSTGRDVVIEADDPAGVTAAPFQIGVVTCGDFTDATGAAKAINDANARLIVAAPTMLAKLREIAGECCECDGRGIVDYDDPDGTYKAGDACPICKDIREVITAAEGRQS